MINLTERNTCCICRSPKLVPFKDIRQFPVYMGVTSEKFPDDILVDQNWVTCANCDTLQLKRLIPLEVLYQKNHHSSVVGDMWKNHHERFSNFVMQKEITNICEIGSAHDHLAGLILNKDSNIEYLSIEPDQTYADTRVRHIKGFAEDNLNEIKKYNVIVHSHVLEHLYMPSDFLQLLSRNMRNDSRMCISFPNIEALLLQNGVNALNFEHTYFLTPNLFQLMCSQAQLKIIRYEEYGSHSYFYEVVRSSKELSEITFENRDSKNRLFLEMWQRMDSFIEYANQELSKCNSPVFLFGAHVFSQALLNRGLSQSAIRGILDNSQGKQNLRLYGTQFNTFKPEIIGEYNDVIVILKASHYQDEIRQQLTRINGNVRIIE